MVYESELKQIIVSDLILVSDVVIKNYVKGEGIRKLCNDRMVERCLQTVKAFLSR